MPKMLHESSFKRAHYDLPKPGDAELELKLPSIVPENDTKLKKLVESETEEEYIYQSTNELDENDYDSEFSSPNQVIKINSIEKLAMNDIIDTNDKNWPKISKKLHESLLESDLATFETTLKVYYKIITTNYTSRSGYLCLLKAAVDMSNSKYIYTIQSNISDSRIIRVLYVILKTQQFVLRQNVSGESKILSEIMFYFVCLISNEVKLNGNTYKVAEYCSLLDPKANWLRNFTVSIKNRSTIFRVLANNTQFMSNNLDTLLNPLIMYDDATFLSRIYCKNLEHSANILLVFYSFQENFSTSFYSTVLKKDFTVHDILEIVINTLNKDWHSELNRILQKIFVSLCAACPTLINSDLFVQIIEPIYKINKLHQPLKNVARNSHILEVVNIVVQTNFKLLYHINTNSKNFVKTLFTINVNVQNTFYVPQMLVDTSILLIRSYINTSENDNDVPEIILDILDCVRNIYNAHPIFFSNVNSTKLITILKSFYKTVSNYDGMEEDQQWLLELLMFFFKFCPKSMIQTINDDLFMQDILSEVFEHGDSKEVSMVLCKSAPHKFMREVTDQNYPSIVKANLKKIWLHLDGKEKFTPGSGLEVDMVLFKFLKFYYEISFNFNAVEALLSSSYDNELFSEKPLVLRNIIMMSFVGSNSTLVEFLGSLIIKIIIHNADVLLFLIAHFRDAQENSDKSNTNLSLTSEDKLKAFQQLNAVEYLRDNICLCSRYYGFVNSEWNVNITKELVFSSPNIGSSRSGKNLDDLHKFLRTTKSGIHDQGWINQARKIFKKGRQEINKTLVITELLEQVPKSKETINWPSGVYPVYELFDEEHCGIRLIVNFGLEKGILNPSSKNEENLEIIIQQLRLFLNYTPEDFNNFDWFAGIAFLICYGNIEKCKAFLINVSNTQIGAILWFTYGREYGLKKQLNFYQQVAILLEEHFNMHSVLKMNNLNSELIIKQWLSQCFFNILLYEEICTFLIFSVLYPPECVICYVVVLFLYNKASICAGTHELNLEHFLNMFNLERFRLSEYLTEIENLYKQYKNVIKL